MGRIIAVPPIFDKLLLKLNAALCRMLLLYKERPEDPSSCNGEPPFSLINLLNGNVQQNRSGVNFTRRFVVSGLSIHDPLSLFVSIRLLFSVNTCNL